VRNWFKSWYQFHDKSISYDYLYLAQMSSYDAPAGICLQKRVIFASCMFDTESIARVPIKMPLVRTMPRRMKRMMISEESEDAGINVRN
ncbi:MAG: hypothetical protein VW270_26965, partial [Candidatus Poseidoniales archaeon]